MVCFESMELVIIGNFLMEILHSLEVSSQN